MALVPFVAAGAAEGGALTTIYGIGGGSMITAEGAGYGVGSAIAAEGLNYLKGQIKKRVYSSLKAGGENLKTRLSEYMNQPKQSRAVVQYSSPKYKAEISRDRGRPMKMMRSFNQSWKGVPTNTLAWRMIQKRKKTNRKFY